MGLVGDLTPVCTITGGSNTAATIQSRLLSCAVVDAAGSQSDSIRIEIDAQGLDEWPETGQVIGCQMGYQESGAVDLGRFKLSRISESLVPNKITLNGTAAPFQAKDETEFKRRRSKSWFGLTLGELVNQIAERHGFSARVVEDLAAVPTFHLDQTDEIDVAFLQRIAKKHDAVCKPVDGLLVFCRKGQVKSLSGKRLEPVVVRWPDTNLPGKQDFVSALVNSSDKQKYSGITAQWYSSGSAEEQRLDLGDKPRKRLPDVFESEAAAKAAAEAEMRKIKRQGDQLSMECPGNALLGAEGLVKLEGVPSSRARGDWSADRVTHNFNSRGYRCSVAASKPV